VIVQDPKTAVYSSMPSSAVVSVAVDFVLPVEEMPALLPLTSRIESAKTVDISSEERSSTLTCPECRGPLLNFRSR
jgi:hypothetical protein